METDRARLTIAGVAVVIVAALVAWPVVVPGATRYTVVHYPIKARWTGHTTQFKMPPGLKKIKHIIIIMQENRSFDSYFGTYPGAAGIPMRNGVPRPCLPNPATQRCVRPYHDRNDRNIGGYHASGSAISDINGGKMNGFIRVAENAESEGCSWPDTTCKTNPSRPDVMGYHNGRDIPNYWSYARNFVLQDHMFAPNIGPSLPSHLYMV